MPSESGTDLRLDPAERRWVKLKWAEIRAAQQKADAANNDWKRISGEINQYLNDSGITDIVQRVRIKSESLPLKEALAVGDWHSRNAERHLLDLQVFLQARALGVSLA